jgi:hypothetical protein
MYKTKQQEVLMLGKASLAIVVGLLALPQISLAADDPGGECVEVSTPKREIIAQHGKWTELTSAQWQFLRGVYVLNPNTPPGLPYGDKAVLVQADGRSGGLVLFIDGEMACTPMAIPQPLLAIVQGVATAAVNHVRTGP